MFKHPVTYPTDKKIKMEAKPIITYPNSGVPAETLPFNYKFKILRSWSIMFGLVELEFRLDGEGGSVTLIFVFIFYLVWLILGCIPKIGFVTCLKVP